MSDPTVSRPHMPGYGIKSADKGAGLLPWEWVSERMAASRSYWVSTTRPDGRPHATPVWGIWLDDIFYFGAGATSVKARNLAANPHVVVHLESGDDVVILEGRIQREDDRALLSRVAVRYNSKYKMDILPEDGSGDPLFALRPAVVMAWLESDFPHTATRWRFTSSEEG